jgi:hypothetical protein
MPRDSNGVFSLVPSYNVSAGQTIEPNQYVPVVEDVAAALTGSLPRNGSAPMTGTLNMGGNALTNFTPFGTAAFADGAVTTAKVADGAVTDAKLAPQARADVASATTTDIGAAASQYVRITGTTTITGLGTAAAGVVRDVLFEGALTLTHNATSLILPGGATITTAAGDAALFRSEGSGNWRCVRYSRASGQALVVPLNSVVFLSDIKAAGTNGGGFANGAWRTRDLNNIVDDDGISSLSGNQFTLPAGTYAINATVPAYAVGQHKARLFNVTDNTEAIQGTTELADSIAAVGNSSTIRGRFVVPSGGRTFRIEHICQVTTATFGFGRVVTTLGGSEVFTVVEIRKVA